jgi:hypothetical protein
MGTLTDAVNTLVTNTTSLQTTVSGRITDMDGKIASADTAKVAAEAAKAGAEVAKSLADTAKTDAQTAQTLAESAKAAAESARTTAATAKTDALLAKAATDTAKGNAVAAQAAAESARGNAEEWASKTSGAVAGGEMSAKYHAQTASTDAGTATTKAAAALASANAAGPNATTAANAVLSDRYTKAETDAKIVALSPPTDITGKADTNHSHSEITSTQLGDDAHELTTMNTPALWSKPAGYMTMVKAAGSNGLPADHGQSYFGYMVTSRRDTGTGYSAILSAYNNTKHWITYNSNESSYPTWREISGFHEYNATLSVNMGNSASYNWSGHGIPGNVWVSATVFLSSTDAADQSDHFSLHMGNADSTATSWGDTFPAAVPPHGVTPFTHLGDSQGVAIGHYGDWMAGIFKTASDGSIKLRLVGTSGNGSGVYVKVNGYWG